MSDDAPADAAPALEEAVSHDDDAEGSTVDDIHGNTLTWLGPDLARLIIPSGGAITGAMMSALDAALRRRSATPVRVHVVAGGLYSVNREAFRASVSAPLIDSLYALAISVGGGPAAGLVNTWFRLYKPPYPARVFSELAADDALTWLKTVDADHYRHDDADALPIRRIAVAIAGPVLIALALLGVLVVDDSLSSLASAALGIASAALGGIGGLGLFLYRSRVGLMDSIQSALRDSEALAQRESDALQAFLEEAVEAILTIDHRGRIRRFNRAAERLFGYGPDEVLGKNVSMLMPEPDHSRHDGYLARYGETGKRAVIGSSRDVTALHKDGTTRPVRLSVSETPDTDGKPLFTGMLYDLSELRRVEREAKLRAERLLEANQDLQSFSRALSHDLRTPLRGIQQLATWVREDLGEGASVEVSENLDLLLERATRLENMITQLHAFARVNADQHALSEVIDVNNLIDVVEDQLGIPPGFEVIRDIAQPEIRHLRAPIELIIRNLVQNAIRHHHRGEGRVWVRTVAHTDGCTLCVEDDGPGIPEKHRERVFEPLETLRPRDDGAGSGLGLSLVRRTVKQLNGYLVLRESAHGGARFVIDLPVPTLDDSVSAE